MPVVEIHLIEGYTEGDKQRLGTALTGAVLSVVPAAADAITVLMHDLPATDYYRGGERRSPAPALPDPVILVRDFLAAMEAREIAHAETMLHEGFKMIFPGTAPMTRLQELVDWARPRYHYVKKTYRGFDVSQDEDRQVVFARGTLEGEWPNGEAFGGVRFLDRFELQDGKIIRQDVWNDLGEVRP